MSCGMNLRTFWDAPRPKFHDTIAILSLSLSLWAWKPEKIEDFSFVITRQRLLSWRKFIWNFFSYQGWPMGYWLCSPSSVCKLKWIAISGLVCGGLLLWNKLSKILVQIDQPAQSKPIHQDLIGFNGRRWLAMT